MSRKLNLDGPATVDEIDDARKKHPDPHDQERLLAIRMAHQGRFSVGDIALAVGRSKRCIRHWLQTYRQGSLDGLLARSNGHCQAVTVKPALSLRYKPPSLRNCAKGVGKRPKTSRPGCAKSMALS